MKIGITIQNDDMTLTVVAYHEQKETSSYSSEKKTASTLPSATSPAKRTETITGTLGIT